MIEDILKMVEYCILNLFDFENFNVYYMFKMDNSK